MTKYFCPKCQTELSSRMYSILREIDGELIAEDMPEVPPEIRGQDDAFVAQDFYCNCGFEYIQGAFKFEQRFSDCVREVEE